MKTKLLQLMTKIRPALVLAALLFPLSSWAQNIIYDAPVPQSEYTIIRNYKEAVDIGCDIIGDVFVFSYNDRNTGIIRYFPLPRIGVNDFEILNDTVFFCGTNVDSNRAAFGWFSIYNVFFGADNIYLKTFSTNQNDIIHYFNNMEVTAIAGTIHIYLTGYANFSFAKSRDPYCEGVFAEARRDTYGNWKLQYVLDTSRLFDYTDMAITDNYVVVAAGKKVGTSGYSHCIIPYYLQTVSTAYQSIFSLMPSITSNTIAVAVYETDPSIFSWFSAGENFIITNMEEDGVATVLKAWVSSPPNYVEVVNIYDNPTSQPIRRFYFYNTAAQRYFGLKYNPLCQTLYFVQDYPGWEFFSTKYPYSSLLKHFTSDTFVWFDMDIINGTYKNILSGWDNSNNDRKLWVFDGNSDNCCFRNEVETTALSNDQEENRYIQRFENGFLNDNNIKVKVEQDLMSVICR